MWLLLEWFGYASWCFCCPDTPVVTYEFAEGASSGSGEAATAAAAELGRTSSLAAVVEQATLRAEALLSNAK